MFECKICELPTYFQNQKPNTKLRFCDSQICLVLAYFVTQKKRKKKLTIFSLSFILSNFLVQTLLYTENIYFSIFLSMKKITQHILAFVWQFQYCPKRPDLPRHKKGPFELFGAKRFGLEHSIIYIYTNDTLTPPGGWLGGPATRGSWCVVNIYISLASSSFPYFETGKVAKWQSGKLAKWQNGKMAKWQSGKLAKRQNG